MEMVENFLVVNNLNKTYNNQVVLNDISFSVNRGEFVSVLGSSGCGKTTLLSILIGILKPDSGVILMDGENITDIDSSKRKMGIVFQNYALFPHMTALRNVEYALAVNKETKATANTVARALLEKMGLAEHMDKRPSKLSGGQQQRVAIARTLALNPQIILFDEPMSALDVSTRIALRDELKKIQDENNITMIYITHDQEEAFSMSDRIIVMDEGGIAQYDTPSNIVKNPANEYVQKFVVQQLEKKVSALIKYLEK